MSIEAMSVALHHSRATGTVKLVMLGICNHDGDGGAWPSVATLARYAGLGGKPESNAKVVRRAVASLVALGEIRVYIQAGGTKDTPDHLRTNRYVVTLRCPEDCDGTKRHRSKRPTDDPRATQPPVPGSDVYPPGGIAQPPKPSGEPSDEPSDGVEWPNADASGAPTTFQDWRAEDRALFADLVGSEYIDSDPEEADRIRFTAGRWTATQVYDALVRSDDVKTEWPGRYLAALDENDYSGTTVAGWLGRYGLIPV